MRVLVTGGAGFIGSNLVDSLLSRDVEVTIADNLSRKGTNNNLEWLRMRYGSDLDFVSVDIRDATAVAKLVRDRRPDQIFHLAAQVAVTTSVVDPVHDFEVNALGTINLLEAIRNYSSDSLLLYTSTNKVYGALESVEVREEERRYSFADRVGVDELTPLDFHSPYGCSKGAADQYVRDYSRVYGIRTIVFRMSCIYGTRQFGNEDQGWIAHFLISAAQNKPIAIYGNGKQTRDVLWVDDLVRAFDSAMRAIETTSGQIYNIGGGPKRAMSIWEEFATLLSTHFAPPDVSYSNARPGDQPLYISDTSKAFRDFGWEPRVTPAEGVSRLAAWIKENSEYFFKSTVEREKAVTKD